MDNNNMKKTQFNIKMTAELKEKLQEIAIRDQMPVSKIIFTSLAVRHPELVEYIIKH